MFRPAHEPRRLPVRWLALILLIGLAIRVGLSLYFPADRAALEALPDQLEYVQLAESLLESGELTIVDERYAAPQPLRAQRMPGYPLLVAASGANVAVVRIVQALLDVSTALAVFLLARVWLTDRAALLAAVGVALSPFLAWFSTLVLSETLFTCLLAWGTLGLVWSRWRTVHWWWGIGLLVASVYVRPTGALLAVAMALIVALMPGRQPGSATSRWPLPAGLTTVLLTMLVLFPWAWRNRMVLGEWIWTTTNGGITLYDGWNLDNTTGGSDQQFVQRMPQLALMNEAERSTYLRDKALAEIRADWGRAAVLAGKKALRTWSPVPLSEADRPAMLTIGLAYSLPLFGLAIVGLLGRRLPGSAKAVLLTPAVVLTVAHMATVGSLRYRLPADPLLAVLAAAGAVELWERRRRPDADMADNEADARGTASPPDTAKT